MTGTSTNTPTTVANAAPDCKPKSDMATATDNSKKLQHKRNSNQYDVQWIVQYGFSLK